MVSAGVAHTQELCKLSGLEVDGNDENVPHHLTCERPFITWWGGESLPNIFALIYLGWFYCCCCYSIERKRSLVFIFCLTKCYFKVLFFFPIKKNCTRPLKKIWWKKEYKEENRNYPQPHLVLVLAFGKHLQQNITVLQKEMLAWLLGCIGLIEFWESRAVQA